MDTKTKIENRIMSQSLANVLIHVVFSTKKRLKLLHDEFRPELYSYIVGIFKNKNYPCYQIGGTADHIHIACSLPRNVSVSDLVKEIKTSTSIWLKNKDTGLTKFYWQAGYGVFSLSPAHLGILCNYIANQENHHQGIDFKKEILKLLKNTTLNMMNDTSGINA